MAAAMELLDKHGIEGVGVRQIAREVGVAHSAPANHFANKRALLTAMATRSFESLLRRLQSAISAEQGLAASLHALTGTMLEYALAFPHRYALMWRKDCVNGDDEALEASMEAVYQLLLQLLQDQPVRQGVDAESQAIAIWSLIHGYVSLRLDGNLGEGCDAMTGADRASAIVDVLLQGVQAGE